MKVKRRTAVLLFISYAFMAGSVVSAADAAEFHSASAPVTLNGTQSTAHKWTTDAGTVTCKVATFTGTQSTKTSSSSTMTPTYKECVAFGFINVPIHTNGCAYLYGPNGTTALECPAGKMIEITTPGCTTTIGPFHFSFGTTFANDATRVVLKTKHETKGIPYDECGSATTGAAYTGETTVTGAGGVAVWWE
jgi:hypothetical protein